MKKNNVLRMLLFGVGMLYGQSAYCNIIWPALFIAESIFTSFFLVTISIAIEALLLYWLLKNISKSKAFLISLVGNIVSTVIGTIIMAAAMLLWHYAFEDLWGGTFSTPNVIASYIFMYLGSSCIELISIKYFSGTPHGNCGSLYL